MVSLYRSLQTFQSYAQPLLSAFRKPSTLLTQSTTAAESLLGRIRSMDNKQWASVGVIGAEVLGFFTVGEMIGRFKVVGYRSDKEHHETATTTH